MISGFNWPGSDRLPGLIQIKEELHLREKFFKKRDKNENM